MSMKELEAKVQTLRELRRMADELEMDISAATDELKAYMTATQTEEISGPTFKISWKTVTSSRLDTKYPLRSGSRTVPAIYEADHFPAVWRGIRNAPCLS